MDGLSAAASGIAVVSLAIQLVDSVREIQRFLRSIADAPEELSRLLDLLEQLELILESVGKLVENQRAQYGVLDIDVSPSILKAIQSCDKTLKKLDGFIDKTRRTETTKSQAVRSLGRFRLACKKGDIDEYEMQLYYVISKLNLVMTTNLTAFHSYGMENLSSGVSAIHDATSAITRELVVLRMDIAANNNTQIPNPKSLIHTKRILQSRTPSCSTHKVVYRGILGVVTARFSSRSRSPFEEDQDRNARDETSWLIIPSFLSRCMQVQCTRSFESIERTLRTYPILRNDHPAWQMCRNGEVTRLQQLFSTREISPYSVNDKARYYNFETCDLLLSLGIGAKVVDAYGLRATGLIFLADVFSTTIESTYRLFVAADQDMDFTDFCYSYFFSLGTDIQAAEFRTQVHQWVTEKNVNLFVPGPLIVVARRISALDIDQVEVLKWQEIARYLISKKAALHGICPRWYAEMSRDVGMPSLIDFAMSIAKRPFDAEMIDPFDSEVIGARLLDMLRAARVDLAEYLAIERRDHLEELQGSEIPFLKAVDLRRRVLNISHEEPFSLSWDWWIDPEGNAFEVLHEFKHFEPDEHDIRMDYVCREEQHNWPYIYPRWVHRLEMLEGGWPTQERETAFAKLFKRRFERRWQNKMTKLAKMQGTYKKPRMPGTWID
ncbi:uncharacterized protein PAC_07898 [Phialocephala subalpina]|uniref:Fungal N-terminal domain-containing protein n=1 Tax=Phialocephala subalpina TaxID=576137 RepID=A0A1L7WZ08_9HELO|nr:uncharacterized protein PAC_07898 [Phialocephala subalpina]